MAKSATAKVETPNFQDILDRQSTEIDRPKPLPVGSYTAMIQGLPRHDKSQKKGTPFVEFTLKILSAGDDVDEDDLNSALTKASGEVVPLMDKTMRLTFYITEDSVYRLKDFLAHCGIDLDDKTMRQALDETPGRQVGITVKHTASEDGDAIYANIGKTFSVE